MPGWKSLHDKNSYGRVILDALSSEYGIDLKKPFKDLSERDRNLILYGTEGRRLNIYYKGAHSEGTFDTAFDGIMGNIRRRYREASESARQEYEQYMQIIPCKTCGGRRLKKEALAVTVGDKNISEVTDLSIVDLSKFMKSLELTVFPS